MKGFAALIFRHPARYVRACVPGVSVSVTPLLSDTITETLGELIPLSAVGYQPPPPLLCIPFHSSTPLDAPDTPQGGIVVSHSTFLA